ncbi:MAG: response regulator [Lachnospiraceae bacterium]|nr:response regulator [Lachnospiraceae bacterium]
MANQLVWEDRFNIGVDFIDNEHMKLFKIINKLFTFSENKNKSSWVCQEGIKYFKDHAIKHFAEEEAYMASISYKELETHTRLHKDFRLYILPAHEKELEQSKYSEDAINHFLGVCAGWLISHTLTEDRAIAGNEITKWPNLPPEEELAAVRQIILELIYDLFRLEAQVISEAYNGERFGHGIYYQLVYSTKKGEQQEIILVFEEKLLIDTVGKLMGSQPGKMDVMIMNAARFVAKQFVECIKEHFPSKDTYEIKSENLLSYEQFQKAFKRQVPKYSLLFNTGAGYFAYCAMTPHTVKKTNMNSIKTENAITEVKEYLTKTEEENNSGKKKLLIVDDSNTILQFMKKLLQKDYQVDIANSGVSAIRCITLERPDLILLDHDMPVCDGAQVLQMIRSETAFGDIPVMFLTGRADANTVSKIIPMKIEGYMLKTLKPADIKKTIDNYFIRQK